MDVEIEKMTTIWKSGALSNTIMVRARTPIALSILLLAPLGAQCNTITSDTVTNKSYNNSIGLVQNLADPYVLRHDGAYYLYGTTDVGSQGIIAYTSTDLINWGKPVGATNGYALHNEQVWGDKWFWSPEVLHLNNKFYMIYSVEEHLAVATSDSPLGPFTQPKPGPIQDIKQIGQKTLFDGDKVYLYFSRFDQGNIVFGAEMTTDLLTIKEETVTRLFDQSQEWEHTKTNPDPKWPVAEAPLVVKHKNLYYLIYTANHFRSPDYAVGYATAPHPLGPYTKYKGNPILKSSETIKGTGTSIIATAPDGSLYMFYHAHLNAENVHPRKTLMDKMEFVKQPDRSPDIIKVHGPTDTPQHVNW